MMSGNLLLKMYIKNGRAISILSFADIANTSIKELNKLFIFQEKN